MTDSKDWIFNGESNKRKGIWIQFGLEESWRTRFSFLSLLFSVSVFVNCLIEVGPRGHGGRRFKLWKQSLAEMLGKAVYNRPLWSDHSWEPAYSGSSIAPGCSLSTNVVEIEFLSLWGPDSRKCSLFICIKWIFKHKYRVWGKAIVFSRTSRQSSRSALPDVGVNREVLDFYFLYYFPLFG